MFEDESNIRFSQKSNKLNWNFDNVTFDDGQKLE